MGVFRETTPNRQNHKRTRKRNRTFGIAAKSGMESHPSAEIRSGRESVVCSYAAKRLCGEATRHAPIAPPSSTPYTSALSMGSVWAHVGGEKLATA